MSFPRRVLRASVGWFTGRLVQLGMLEDEGLNVIAFDGEANGTVSTHTSLAAGYRPDNIRLPPEQRKWWGCVGCRMLSFLVQKAHCWNVMNNVPMVANNYVRAFGCITIVLVAPFIIRWWAIVLYLVAIAPFALLVTVSRERQSPQKVSSEGKAP